MIFLSKAYANSATLLSRGLSGNSANDPSFTEDISTDGSAVVFTSEATDIVENDTNFFEDLFYVDTFSGAILRINVNSSGGEALYGDPENFGTPRSGAARLNGDGTLVVYESNALNLVSDDTNQLSDIFLWDKSLGFSSRVSISSTGQESSSGAAFHPGISDDGRFIVFSSYSTDLVPEVTEFVSQIYLRDRLLSITSLVSRSVDGIAGDNDSQSPVISADGRFVAFNSAAGNLTDTDTDNTGGTDVFVFDIENQTTEKVNVSSTGEEANGTSQFFVAPAISGDGRLVTFQSEATNLVPSDTNGLSDLFLRDIENNETRRVNVSNSGEQSNTSTSETLNSDISSDGRFVTFSSFASNLVEGDNNDTDDNFVRDLKTDSVTIVNTKSDGTPTTNRSFLSRINGDGRYIAYTSRDGEIMPPDDNFAADVFLVDTNALCDISETRHQFNLPDNEFALLSLPCAAPLGTTVSELFEDDIGAPYGSLNWVVFTFDPTLGNSGGYVDIGPSGELVPGQGFWIIQATGQTKTLTLPEGSREVSLTDIDDPACQSSLGCNRLALSGLDIPVDQTTGASLETRWNMLGNPFNVESNLPAAQIRITTGAGTCVTINGGCTLEEAVLPSIDVSPNVIFRYNIMTGVYQPITVADSINAWDGLWVGELNQAVNNSPEIVIPLVLEIPVASRL